MLDPLYIIENPQKLKPAFQPVISASTHTVIGYEVIGRFEENGKWLSLSDFFKDPDVPDDYKIDVDRTMLQQAVDKMLEVGSDGLLFISRNVTQLLSNSGEDFLENLQGLERKGFPLKRIVLEVTEHDFDEDFDVLAHLLTYYKTYGIQVAVDHVGAKSSNIDRIRQLRPNILKINTGISRNNNPDIFEDIIYSLSLLARRIGAKLAYEKIEDKNQLYFAWKHGGHFYQGSYLAEPSFTPLSINQLPKALGNNVMEFVQREKSLIEGRFQFAAECEGKVKRLLAKWQGPEQSDLFIKSLLEPFNTESFRIYICGSDGRQVSSNFRKRSGKWESEVQAKGANWAFRPYFLENVVHMKTWQKGTLSDNYSDIETGETVRTFSYPLPGDYFLYIDIGYSFIYENDFLYKQ